jgi:hypothetical protein
MGTKIYVSYSVKRQKCGKMELLRAMKEMNEMKGDMTPIDSEDVKETMKTNEAKTGAT